jgi:hypothetical protein
MQTGNEPFYKLVRQELQARGLIDIVEIELHFLEKSIIPD